MATQGTSVLYLTCVCYACAFLSSKSDQNREEWERAMQKQEPGLSLMIVVWPFHAFLVVCHLANVSGHLSFCCCRVLFATHPLSLSANVAEDALIDEDVLSQFKQDFPNLGLSNKGEYHVLFDTACLASTVEGLAPHT